MRDDARKVAVAAPRDPHWERELPMPAYQYQSVFVRKSPALVGQQGERKPVEDMKIKSLQNLSFA